MINLLRSCLPPSRLTFCSSIASISASLGPYPLQEEISTSPSDSDNKGYSQSKWVAEAICSSASKLAELKGRIKIVRLGQLTGDTENGVWNMSEAWPLMLGTVKVVGSLPRISQELNWLPFDVAARCILDISFTEAEGEGASGTPVYHVLNNSKKHNWKDLLRWVAEFRDEPFEVVDPMVWLERMDQLKSHPAKNLLWLWKQSLPEQMTKDVCESKKKEMSFSTQHSGEVSKSFANFSGVDKALVRKIWDWLDKETQSGGQWN